MPRIRSLSLAGRDVRLIHYAQVTSTQRVARGLVERGAASGTIVVADSQTAGCGRYGREWISPPGGLYASIVLNPDPLLPVRAGVAVAEALIDYGVAARLKWPNDVTVDGKKIAGILIEEAFGTMILGIGVNLKEAPYPGSTSVFVACGRAPRPEEFVLLISGKLFGPRVDEALIERYRGLCVTIGKEVSIVIRTERITGRAVGIDRSGKLILKRGDGVRLVSSGECIHLSG